MADLSAYADASFDLVYSGQSIEHVPVDVADKVLAEVARVLRPGGYLGLDTPNARVCRLQQAEFIDPDHDHEYTHGEMVEKLAAPVSRSSRPRASTTPAAAWPPVSFSTEDVATHRGLFADIESCYLLSYVCRTHPEAPDVTDDPVRRSRDPRTTTPTGPTSPGSGPRSTRRCAAARLG